MKEVNDSATKFLDNIILSESMAYQNIFLNSFAPWSKQKQNLLELVLKINCCKEIIQPSYSPNEIAPNYLQIGLGYWINEIRNLKVSDAIIQAYIFSFRDDFLKTKELVGKPYQYILAKKQCVETYDTVRIGLIKKLDKIK